MTITSIDDGAFERAMVALQAGNVQDAEPLFKAVLRTQPRHIGALNLLGIVLTRLGRFAEAESYLRQALQVHAGSDATLYNYGVVLKALNRPAEALERFTQALAINPWKPETWHTRGIVLNDLRRFEEALGDFAKAVELNPRYAEAWFARGNALRDLKRYEDALVAYGQALALRPDWAIAHNNLGSVLVHLGGYAEALTSCDRAIALNPGLVLPHGNRGGALFYLKRYAEALASCERAISLDAGYADGWVVRGNVLIELKRHGEALAAYDRALALRADLAEAWLGRGNVLTEQRRHDDAFTAYDRALALQPDLAEAWLGRGNVLTELKHYGDALATYGRALSLKPDLAKVWLGRGNVLTKQRRRDDALAAYDKALALQPDLAEAWHGRGNVLTQLKRYSDALAAYDRALGLKADLAEAWLGRGNVFNEQQRCDDAFAAYERALALKPDLAEAWLGRGKISTELKRYDDAFAAYERALALKPDFAEARVGQANVFNELRQYDDALAAYERALALQPDLAEAWLSLGNVLLQLPRYAEALTAYERAAALQPDLDYALGYRLLSKLMICDWTNLEEESAKLLATVREGTLVNAPFPILALPSSPRDQLHCAKRFIEDQPRFAPVWCGELYSHDRIRVAYLSADFREHPVADLTVGLFESHDKKRFEITGLSYGPDQDSPTRHRIKGAFERFIDVRDNNDNEVADLIRRLEIDVAVDLMGFTANSRPNVLARRPAPIQVNYLGYAGTIGTSYIDYILADPTIIPEDQCEFYSERVVWLSESYQVYDNGRQASEYTPSRRECGLPDKGFVYCCFNNTYKISPEIFGVWMRLLKAVDGSVLWLKENDALASHNLLREAERRGVAPERLIFAKRVPRIEDHLARHRQADLFLDTLPYNAHTTASDALAGGLPVLTCLGSTFAGRVAASLLHAIGLDELVTRSLDDYESLALYLARNPSYHGSVKEKLARNRLTSPLFDTERATRQIEAAYIAMWQRYQRGEAPRTPSDRSSPISLP